MADTNRYALRYVKEATWGTTPSSALQTLRPTSGNFRATLNTIQSAELIQDAQLRALILAGKAAAGEFGYELSYGTWDELLEGVFRGTWQPDTGLAGAESGTDLLENGTTAISYTFEEQNTDLSSVYASVTGARIGSWSISLALDSVVGGSFGAIVGKAYTPGAATVGTGPAVAATTTSPFSVTDITAVSEGGSPLTGVTGLTIEVNNNLRAEGHLGSTDLFRVGYGQFLVTGTLNVYLSSNALRTKVANFTASSIGAELTDEDGNIYEFSIPRVRYGEATSEATGPNGSVILTLPWTAERDPTTGKSLRLTRTAA